MASFFTNPLATKRTGIEKISTLTSLALSETLAVGDSTNDWTFMELCGYVATLGNGTPELKELVKNKENGNGYITKKTVNQDGILDIFDHFGV
jgi:hydroxymethylpyrimidine pyrophosphatase-like HAD family hydrolase